MDNALRPELTRKTSLTTIILSLVSKWNRKKRKMKKEKRRKEKRKKKEKKETEKREEKRREKGVKKSKLNGRERNRKISVQ